MLLSAGGFAVYRSESNVFNLLAPHFGEMRSASDRKKLLDQWLNSILFRVSGLDAADITAKVMEECHSPGDFLRIVMGEVAQSQSMWRWADCTPEHLLYMTEIRRQIPDALFIHIIRDGRDVALSYLKQGWTYPLPWDEHEHLGVAGLYWKWIVGTGRECGKVLGECYREVRFEDLVRHPQETLSGLSEFIDHDLNFETITRAPNSSFGAEAGTFDPVERWRTKMSNKELADFEALVGDRLVELNYPLVSGGGTSSLRTLRLKATYLTMFPVKQWLKAHTPLGRTVRLGRIQIEHHNSR
jgi:hypothetical protein